MILEGVCQGVQGSYFLLVLRFDHQRAQNPKEMLGINPGSTSLGLGTLPKGVPSPIQWDDWLWLTGARLQFLRCFVRKQLSKLESLDWEPENASSCPFPTAPWLRQVSSSLWASAICKNGGNSLCHYFPFGSPISPRPPGLISGRGCVM